MSTAAAGRIHQASELNARYRVILDEAKADGMARLRDSDGTAIMIVPERRIQALENEREAFGFIARALRSFLPVEQAVRAGRRPEGLELGDWAWLRELDVDDLREFVDEIRAAIGDSLPELDARPVRDVIDAWRTTADTLRDPLSRETLLGRSSDEMYVEAGRPE